MDDDLHHHEKVDDPRQAYRPMFDYYCLTKIDDVWSRFERLYPSWDDVGQDEWQPRKGYNLSLVGDWWHSSVRWRSSDVMRSWWSEGGVCVCVCVDCVDDGLFWQMSFGVSHQKTQKIDGGLNRLSVSTQQLSTVRLSSNWSSRWSRS